MSGQCGRLSDWAARLCWPRFARAPYTDGFGQVECDVSAAIPNGADMSVLVDQVVQYSAMLVDITIALRFATAVIVFISTVTFFVLRVRRWLRRRRNRR